MAQRKESGWFEQMGFTSNEVPLTHTIAYTLRGLLECSPYLTEAISQKSLAAVQRASEKILVRSDLTKHDAPSRLAGLPATLDEEWKSDAYYSCLTGNAQIAIILLKLYELNNDRRLLTAVHHLVDQLKATQSLNNTNLGIKGGIAGSYPIWGGYGRFAYLNWATKFFADALLLKASLNLLVSSTPAT